MPNVSVIIPTYNRAEYASQAIDSVLQQSYKDYEIIVIDDGSTDNTEQRLKSYSDQIIYLKQENKGVNAARNTALRVATGNFVALLDSDDLWLDFKLQLELDVLNKYKDAGFVFSEFFILKPGNIKFPHGLRAWYVGDNCWENVFDSCTTYQPDFTDNDSILPTESIRLCFGDVYQQSLYQPCVLPSASLFRRSLIQDFLKFNEEDSTCGDWEFFARFSHRYQPVFIDIETAFNRSHEDSVRLTRIDSKIQTKRRIDQIDRIWCADNDFYSNYKHEVDQVKLGLLYELSKRLLYDGDPISARQSLTEIDNLNINTSSIKLYIYKILAYFPGCSFLLKTVRSLKLFLS